MSERDKIGIALVWFFHLLGGHPGPLPRTFAWEHYSTMDDGIVKKRLRLL